MPNKKKKKRERKNEAETQKNENRKEWNRISMNIMSRIARKAIQKTKQK